MRRLALLIAPLLVVPAVAWAAQAPSGYLRYGQSSPDVVALQQLLNGSADTQIAAAGPGSPGQETAYFGALTLAAVKRFQSLHGISATGYVGPLTLAALSSLASPPATPNPAQPSVSTSSATLPATVMSTTTALEQYLVTMRAEGVSQGYTKDQLDQLESVVRGIMATTTDYTSRFYAEQQAIYKKNHSVFNRALDTLASLLSPARAQAALGGLPFGGYVATVIPCLCPWTINVQQLYIVLANPTPTSNMNLNYIDGTEAFLWHNLPEPGVATLGQYAPVAQGCWEPLPHDMCYLLPARGTIEPLVGSSLTPPL